MDGCDPFPRDPTPTLYIWTGDIRAPKQGEFYRPSSAFPVMQAEWDHVRPAQIMVPVTNINAGMILDYDDGPP